jgi:hypothetical protein
MPYTAILSLQWRATATLTARVATLALDDSSTVEAWTFDGVAPGPEGVHTPYRSGRTTGNTRSDTARRR